MGIGVELDKANALLAAGRVADVISLLSRVVAKRPKEARALHMLGVAHAQTGNLQDAVKLLQSAVAIAPRSASTLTDLATVLLIAARPSEAIPLLEKARRLDPQFDAAQFYLGNALTATDRHAEAFEIFEGLCKRDPLNITYQQNRAGLLFELGRHEEAVAATDRILKLQPTFAPALVLKSRCLLNQRQFKEAIEACDRAISLDPKTHTAYNNRGVALMEEARHDEALASFDRAIALQPNYADAIYNRGHLQLLLGRFEEGWRDYESRWGRKHFQGKRPVIDAPQWRGEDLHGRSILVYCEQGFGDTIQFSRYALELAAHGADVCLIVPPRLRRLISSLPAQIRIETEPPKDLRIDFQIALLSIPLMMGTQLANVPATVPYLSAESERSARWKNAIGSDGFRIGVAWQGNPGAGHDRSRSIPLREFYPLSRLPGVRLISLQKNAGVEQLQSLPHDMTVEDLGDAFDSGSDAFLDSAAVMQHLDLTISPCTAIAHLAGALGRPVWVPLDMNSDWRWLLERSDSPWYPTARIFRQKVRGDWPSVFQQVESELRLLHR